MNDVHLGGVLPDRQAVAWRNARENEMTVAASWDLFEDLLATQNEVMRPAWGRARRHGHPYDADAGAMGWAPAMVIEATAQDSTLRVLVPKAPDVQAKHIPVRVGQPAAAVKPGGKANGS